jgi:hypothetical protein
MGASVARRHEAGAGREGEEGSTRSMSTAFYQALAPVPSVDQIPRQGTDEWNALWARFQKALAKATLYNEQGQPTQCGFGEFMLMHRTSDGFAFKHWNTRNYVYLRGDRLDIPRTTTAFHRGFF